MGIIEERRRLREKRIVEAREWASRIPLRVTAILIGSFARGDFNLWSDIDILVISEDFAGSPLERLKSLDVPSGHQVIALTPREFRILLGRGEPMAVEAVEHGVILRDDLNLFSTNRE